MQRAAGQIKRLDAPFLRSDGWLNGNRAALAITEDIGLIIIQDLFLRILGVQQNA